MPGKKVWDDFQRLEDILKPAKQGANRNELYARWKCPHCEEVVEVLAAESGKRKQGAFGYHFWNKTKPCPNRPVEDVRGKPDESKRQAPAIGVPVDNRPTREEFDILQDRLSRMEKRHNAICSVLGVSDHSSDDEHEAANRANGKLKRKLEDTATMSYNAVSEAGKWSPMRTSETPTVFGNRVVDAVAGTVSGKLEAEKQMNRSVEKNDHLKERLEVEKRANFNLEYLLEEARTNMTTPSSASVKKMKTKILTMVHPDKAVAKYDSVKEMADSLSKAINGIR